MPTVLNCKNLKIYEDSFPTFEDNRSIEERITSLLNTIQSDEGAKYLFDPYKNRLSDSPDILDDCPVTLYLKSRIPDCQFIAIGLDNHLNLERYILYFQDEDIIISLELPIFIQRYLLKFDYEFNGYIGGHLMKEMKGKYL